METLGPVQCSECNEVFMDGASPDDDDPDTCPLCGGALGVLWSEAYNDVDEDEERQDPEERWL